MEPSGNFPIEIVSKAGDCQNQKRQSIAAISGNPIFAATSEAMLGWLLEYHVGLVRKEGREVKTLTEHRLIIDRIATIGEQIRVRRFTRYALGEEL